MYQVNLKANNTEYSGRGKTVIEALQDIDLPYTLVKTKGTMTVKKGKLVFERHFQGVQLRRLLVSSLVQKMWSKGINDYFDILKKKNA